MAKYCNSCKVEVTSLIGTTSFICPNCGKYEIIRCPTCRKNVIKYKCQNCGFEGPN